MKITFQGVIENGRVRPTEPVQLPEGVPVEVTVIVTAQQDWSSAAAILADIAALPIEACTTTQMPRDDTPTLHDRLQPFVGALKDLPSDMSVSVDHYLYGVPKRQ